MMKKKTNNALRTLCAVIVAALCLASCRPTPPDAVGEPIEMRHATLLHISRAEGYTRVDIRNPWDTTALLHTYLLVPRADTLPTVLPPGTLLRTPLERVAVFTSVHASLLIDLDRSESIVALADVSYILRPEVRALVAEGAANIGSAMQPDIEAIVGTRPDAIFLSPYESSGGHGTLAATGIPIVECADYMEASPLGRAEWIRLYGMLMGCEAAADTMFSGIERRYNELSEKAKASKASPTILPDMITSGTWYVPGAHSTMGRLFADAHLDYPFAEYTTGGSVALTPEKALEKILAHDGGDLWIIKYWREGGDLTYETLAADNPLYRNIGAWQRRRVYGCNTATVPFYEIAPFHPDLLLQNIISIAHPELAPTGSAPQFYTPLQ